MWKSNEDAKFREMLGMVESEQDRSRRSPNRGVAYGKILFRDDDDLASKNQYNQKVPGFKEKTVDGRVFRSPYRRQKHAFGDSVTTQNGEDQAALNNIAQGNPSGGTGWSNSNFDGSQNQFGNAAGQPNPQNPLNPNTYKRGGHVSAQKRK